MFTWNIHTIIMLPSTESGSKKIEKLAEKSFFNIAQTKEKFVNKIKAAE